MDQLTLTYAQARALAEFLNRYAASGDLTITVQGDGSAVFAVELATWEATPEGGVTTEDGEAVAIG